jgi:hypothetical protein
MEIFDHYTSLMSRFGQLSDVRLYASVRLIKSLSQSQKPFIIEKYIREESHVQIYNRLCKRATEFPITDLFIFFDSNVEEDLQYLISEVRLTVAFLVPFIHNSYSILKRWELRQGGKIRNEQILAALEWLNYFLAFVSSSICHSSSPDVDLCQFIIFSCRFLASNYEFEHCKSFIVSLPKLIAKNGCYSTEIQKDVKNLFLEKLMLAVKQAIFVKPEYKFCIQCDNLLASKLCTKCKEARYCSPECQKVDWQRHKIYCGKMTLTEVANQIRKKQDPIPIDEVFKLLEPLMEKYRDPKWNPFST